MNPRRVQGQVFGWTSTRIWNQNRHTSQRTEDTKTQVSTFPRSQEKKPIRKMRKAEEALHEKLE